MRLALLIITIVVLGSLGLGACGGDDDDQPATVTETATEQTTQA
jgi:hypothetical protein